MKSLLMLLLITGYVYGQSPAKSVRRDSVPKVYPPDRMPTTRPYNSFYRNHLDPPNVVRATLDNMSISVPDTTKNYTMLPSYPPHSGEPPMRQLRPKPPVLPKKRW
ncbi:MAG TPA: hypothetical protein VK404_13400 [Spirosoma sp.]|nr:hypothetical protein [Spirosoma sp.]